MGPLRDGRIRWSRHRSRASRHHRRPGLTTLAVAPGGAVAVGNVERLEHHQCRAGHRHRRARDLLDHPDGPLRRRIGVAQRQDDQQGRGLACRKRGAMTSGRRAGVDTCERDYCPAICVVERARVRYAAARSALTSG